MFGLFGIGETLTDFWGPRDVVIDSQGRVYVTDTGNKRIVVFDHEGNPLSILSMGPGSGEGQLNEPVGIAISEEGLVYVADSWNQRVATFTSDGLYHSQWPIYGWYGKSLNNKPYISLDPSGRVFVTDPERYRVMVFHEDGELLFCFGGFGSDFGSFGLPVGLAYDNSNGIYVVDKGNDRFMHFVIEE
jgi:DNA-binding beta-propeller fold protein YncE